MRAAAATADLERLQGLATVTVNGVALAYAELGQGEPVVFVHGSASDLRNWTAQLAAIGRSRRAITYSRRYARPNPEIPAHVDDRMGPHVDDLIALLERLDAAPADLVGHSWGGFVSLLAAIRRPDLVRGLVLLEPPVLPLLFSTPPRPAELARQLVRRPVTALAVLRFGARAVAPATREFRRGNDERAIRRFADGVLGSGAWDRLPPERRRQALDNVASLRAQFLGAGFPPLDDEEVRRVAAPAALLTGERSPLGLRRLSDRLHELLPRSERIEIPAASHRMQEQNPAATNEAILRFLDRRPATPPR